MKKLKNKVFWVIFILLTTFTLIVFSASTIQTYMERKRAISDRLSNIPKESNIKKNKEMEPDFAPQKNGEEEGPRRIYMDFTIYTVVLDENGNFGGLINNTSIEDIDEKKVEKIANKIIKKHDKEMYIGNLYTNKYSYVFTKDNTLLIIDNSELNNILVKQLIFNIILFILCEMVIIAITNLITKWIITPVKKSKKKKKMFVADASHELKTPLAVMIASSDAYLNDKNDKWIKNIRTESERMIKLVTELLDLAKTEQEHEIVFEKKNISNIIEGSVLTFESLFYDNKIKLNYNITPDIEMECNEDLIDELIHILIDNAIKHCKEKGKVTVNLSKKK